MQKKRWKGLNGNKKSAQDWKSILDTLKLFGADDGIWTRDLYITNVVLYLLSYDSKTLYWVYGNFKKMSTLLLPFLKKEVTDLVTSFLLWVYLKDYPLGFLLEGLCLLR